MRCARISSSGWRCSQDATDGLLCDAHRAGDRAAKRRYRMKQAALRAMEMPDERWERQKHKDSDILKYCLRCKVGLRRKARFDCETCYQQLAAEARERARRSMEGKHGT